MPSSSLTVGTFNCTGIKSSIEYIAQNICTKCDIVALQETWLLPNDLAVCDNNHPSFCAFGTSSVDVGAGVLRGRPHGGLAFMYRRTYEAVLSPVTFDDDRILGLQYRDGTQSILFLNVYCHTQSNDNYDKFVSLLGRLAAIINSHENDAFIVLGDFSVVMLFCILLRRRVCACVRA